MGPVVDEEVRLDFHLSSFQCDFFPTDLFCVSALGVDLKCEYDFVLAFALC